MLNVPKNIQAIIKTFKVVKTNYYDVVDRYGKIWSCQIWRSAKYPDYEIQILHNIIRKNDIELYYKGERIEKIEEYDTRDIAKIGEIILQGGF